MPGFRVLILTFSIMYAAQHSRHLVSAQSLKESPVSQADKEISVDIGDSATLRCCVSEKLVGMIAWFKQPDGKKPEMIVKLFKNVGDTFSIQFPNPRFQIEKHSNCFNIILNVSEFDEAVYYCAQTSPDIVFADGTYLKIKGEHVTAGSETFNPPLGDNSVACEPSLHRNITNINTHEITVLGLGTALSLCALLILCLIYLILRKIKRDELNRSMPHSPGTTQKSHIDTLMSAELQFSRNEHYISLSDKLVYSEVKYVRL